MTLFLIFWDEISIFCAYYGASNSSNNVCCDTKIIQHSVYNFLLLTANQMFEKWQSNVWMSWKVFNACTLCRHLMYKHSFSLVCFIVCMSSCTRKQAVLCWIHKVLAVLVTEWYFLGKQGLGFFRVVKKIVHSLCVSAILTKGSGILTKGSNRLYFFFLLLMYYFLSEY